MAGTLTHNHVDCMVKVQIEARHMQDQQVNGMNSMEKEAQTDNIYIILYQDAACISCDNVPSYSSDGSGKLSNIIFSPEYLIPSATEYRKTFINSSMQTHRLYMEYWGNIARIRSILLDPLQYSTTRTTNRKLPNSCPRQYNYLS